MTSKNNSISKLARSVDATGDITAAGISSSVSLGANVYDSIGELPYTGNNAGDQAFVNSNNRLYLWAGTGWYNIALINRAPTISSVQDSDGNTTPFILAIDGTPTTITITAADSDGDPITYSAVADSDFNGLATITGSGNEFTITPFSQDSASTQSGTITFKATDGINISSDISTFTLNFTSPYWDETVLSIGTSSTNNLDNSAFIDRSTNAHTVTPTGTPVQTAFHPYLDNWSVEFDGNSRLFSSSGAYSNFGTGDFTIDFAFWTGQTSSRVISIGDGDDATGLYFFTDATDNMCLLNNGARIYEKDASAVYALNQWNQISIVRSSGTIRIFVNGTALDSKTFTASINGDVRIGVVWYNGSTFGNNLEGYISNVRFIKGSAVNPPAGGYTSALTAVSGTSYLTCQSNRFVDNSSNGIDVTVQAGTPKVSAFNPFGQGSEYAVGENKGSTYSSSTTNQLSSSISSIGTGDFTLECWAYFTGSNVDGDIIFDSRSSGLATDGFAFYRRGSGNFTIYHGSAYEGSVLSDNQWHHLVACRSSGVLKTFINGVEDQSFSMTSNLSRTTVLILGQYNAINGIQGYVADLKLTDSALYTTNFTSPTAPVGNTNASLYLPFDNAGIFDKTGINTLTVVGNASTSTTQTKFADTAIYFDGSDYITISDVGVISGDFTIEGWFYISGTAGQGSSGQQGIFGRGAREGSIVVRIQGKPTKVMSWWLDGSDKNVVGSTALSLNTWYHFALVRSGSNTNNIKLYLNGVLESQGTSTYVSQNEDFIIGRTFTDLNNQHWNGYLENLQILKGVAKYTANFTPPNRTQGRIYQAES